MSQRSTREMAPMMSADLWAGDRARTSAGYESERLDAARLFEDLPVLAVVSSPAAAEAGVRDLVVNTRPPASEHRAMAPTVQIRRTFRAEPRVVAIAIVSALAFIGTAAACSHWHAGVQFNGEQLMTRVQPQ